MVSKISLKKEISLKVEALMFKVLNASISSADKVQNRAIPIIANNAHDESVGPLLRGLELPGISDMIKQESASMAYKALNTETPIFKEQFARVSSITSRILCGFNWSLRPPRLSSGHGQNCFAYRGSSVWNSLPSEIKSSRTFGSFQKKLKVMLTGKD